MKTIKEWINELPEPYRSQALKYETIYWNSKSMTKKSALTVAFLWDDTNESFDYWEKLYLSL